MCLCLRGVVKGRTIMGVRERERGGSSGVNRHETFQRDAFCHVCVVLDLVQVRVRFREDVCAASVCLVACG